MRDDFIAGMIAVCIFPLIALIPGYVIAWIANLLDFRLQSPAWRFAIAVPVSIAAVPILVFWIDKLAGRNMVWGAFSVCWAVFIWLFFKSRRSAPRGNWLVFFAIALVWTAVVFGSVNDLQIGNRLYGSVTASDQSYRTEFTDTLTRTSLSAPSNPFDYVEGPVPLRYHYFWYILSSLIDQLGGDLVPPRQAFIASIVWCGVALACMIALYLRFFTREGPDQNKARLRSRMLKGLALLTITGLDIIPTFTLAAFHNTRYMDMEWWNEAVTSWLGSLLWAPHHVGGLICGMGAFLVLLHAAASKVAWQRWASAAVAGTMLASMLGESIYVGLVMAVFLSLWTIVTFAQGWREHTPVLIAAGLLTAMLAIPYLHSLTGPAAGGSFIQMTVRDFRGAKAFGLPTEFAAMWKTYLWRLLLLPLNYAIELGFFLAAGILYLAKLRSSAKLTREDVAAMLMVATSVTICTFFKSGVISNNDLGWRGFLPAQFVLLIWAVDFIPGKEEFLRGGGWLQERVSPVLPLLLVLGLVSTIYSLGVLRVSEILNDRDPAHAEGTRMLSARIVYSRLREILPPTAIVQQNPELENPVYYGLYSERQTAVAGPGCGATFGGSSTNCEDAYAAVVSIFHGGIREQRVDDICQGLHIDAIIVTSADPVWAQRDSWVWKREPVVKAEFARAYTILPNPPILAKQATIKE